MYDWIVEADLYRLNKQHKHTDSQSGRDQLVPLILATRRELAKLRDTAAPVAGTV